MTINTSKFYINKEMEEDEEVFVWQKMFHNDTELLWKEAVLQYVTLPQQNWVYAINHSLLSTAVS